MNRTKMFTVTAVALASVGVSATVGYLGLKEVAAQIASNQHSTVIENIAKKFNVSTTEVQKVFDDTRTQQQVDRLNNAVKDGTITEAQKAMIVTKQAEVESKIKEINTKQLTAEERQTQIEQVIIDVHTWETANKIPQYLIQIGFGMRGGMRGNGMMGGQGMMRLK